MGNGEGFRKIQAQSLRGCRTTPFLSCSLSGRYILCHSSLNFEADSVRSDFTIDGSSECRQTNRNTVARTVAAHSDANVFRTDSFPGRDTFAHSLLDRKLLDKSKKSTELSRTSERSLVSILDSPNLTLTHSIYAVQTSGNVTRKCSIVIVALRTQISKKPETRSSSWEICST